MEDGIPKMNVNNSQVDHGTADFAAEVTVRLAGMEDVQALVRILKGIGWFERFQQESEDLSLKRVREHLRLCLADDSHTVWLAQEMGGEVVGYLAIHWLPYFILAGPEGFISELFVDKAARSQGVGRLLLKKAEEEGRRRGCYRLMLNNHRSRESYRREFYKKQGWEERETTANFVKLLTRPE